MFGEHIYVKVGMGGIQDIEIVDSLCLLPVQLYPGQFCLLPISPTLSSGLVL